MAKTDIHHRPYGNTVTVSSSFEATLSRTKAALINAGVVALQRKHLLYQRLCRRSQVTVCTVSCPVYGSFAGVLLSMRIPASSL